jgi:lysozyme|tara:strand:+ start:332 stop:733 length:402 start_codon:yes stop_codon:yes gene_type:complete
MIEIDQIKEDEGFRSEIYLCSEGKRTIGYGFNLDAGMTGDEAQALLEVRLTSLLDSLELQIKWFKDAPEEVRSVLLNMAYQLGTTGLLKFKKSLRYLEGGQYNTAAKEMLDSRWFQQTPERAQRLSDRIARLV